MSREQDDDALSWAGEGSDPTLVPTHAAERPVPSVEEPGWQPSTSLSDADDDANDAAPGDAAAPGEAAASSALLVTMGIAAGVYLLYTIGWIITGTRQAPLVSSYATDVVGQFMYSLGLWFAAAAPIAWFVGALFLTRRLRARTRIIWLVLGIIVLVPLPFVQGA
ncbi:DNA polymerase III subunit gamma/tau [Microbacteriaceae bacterium VKM Ac-2855]|nr:DNA polymerase III subunit gamma/tau [Microbacteriaceae bacterium VKM Ac-2855]